MSKISSWNRLGIARKMKSTEITTCLESHSRQRFCWPFSCQVELSDRFEEIHMSLTRACSVGLCGLLHSLNGILHAVAVAGLGVHCWAGYVNGQEMKFKFTQQQTIKYSMSSLSAVLVCMVECANVLSVLSVLTSLYWLCRSISRLKLPIMCQHSRIPHSEDYILHMYGTQVEPYLGNMMIPFFTCKATART